MSIESIIESGWNDRATLTPGTHPELLDAVGVVLSRLDSGEYRVAERNASGWTVHEWLKKAILLSFRLHPNRMMDQGPDGSAWWDKVEMKTAGWDADAFEKAAFRAVPGSIVRKGAYVAPNVVLMPSFVNIGAYIGKGTMIDTWATVGSCAQIGESCHISGGAGIGGVLEPLQASPVIIEDNVFVGARAEVAEGVIVETGSVLSMGVYLGASTRIIDRDSGEVHYGRVPAYSVVVPGSMPGKSGGPNLYCAVIVKRVDEKTRSKTSVNELLRD